MKNVKGDIFDSDLNYAKKVEKIITNKTLWSKSMKFYLRHANGRVLEIGCGTGLCSQFFDYRKYIGIDVSRKLLSVAKKNYPKYKFIIADINQKLPFPDKYFDTVICFWVLHHIPKWEIALNEMKRVGKKIIIAEIRTPSRFLIYLFSKLLGFQYVKFFKNELGKGILIPNKILYGGRSVNMINRIISKLLKIEYRIFIIEV